MSNLFKCSMILVVAISRSCFYLELLSFAEESYTDKDIKNPVNLNI